MICVYFTIVHRQNKRDQSRRMEGKAGLFTGQAETDGGFEGNPTQPKFTGKPVGHPALYPL